MRNPTRTLLIVVLAVAFCFSAVIARESEEERKDAVQPSNVPVQIDPDANRMSPANPTPVVPPLASPDAGEQINWWVIGAGGGTGSSANYALAGTVGQTAVQFGSSPSYGLHSGFWQVFGSGDCCVGRVGDANGLGGDEPTIGDVSVMIDAKFITGTCEGILDCMTEADVNQTGLLAADCDDVTIGDISILIDYLFITGSTLGLNDCL